MVETLSQQAPAPIYARALGDAASQLAAPVAALHLASDDVVAGGTAVIVPARRLPARLLARVLRLPPAADHAHVRLEVSRGVHGELWHRTFVIGRRRWCVDSHQQLSPTGGLHERVGPLVWSLDASVVGRALHLDQRAFHVAIGRWRLRVPAALAPRVAGRAVADDDARVHVVVDIAAPVLGRLVTYRAVVRIDTEAPS